MSSSQTSASGRGVPANAKKAPHPLRVLLDQAGSVWRRTAKTEYPIFSDMPVEKADENPAAQRPWQFCTDGKRIRMDLYKPAVIDDAFKAAVVKLYRDAYGEKLGDDELRQLLEHDTLTYLHFHELLHPAKCPDSKDDEKLVDKALHDGIKKALPHATPMQLVQIIGNVRNSAWDQVIDTDFYDGSQQGPVRARLEQILRKDGRSVPRLPDGVVPVFDIVEFHNQKEKFDSMFYPATRALYGLLFTADARLRGPVVDYFKGRITKQMRAEDLDKLVHDALHGFVAELAPRQLAAAGIDAAAYRRDVDDLCARYADSATDAAHRRVTAAQATLLLDKRTRYDALRGFIQPLAKHVSLQHPESKHAPNGDGGQGGGAGMPGDGQPGDGQGQPSGGPGQPGDGASQPGGGAGQPGGGAGDASQAAVLDGASQALLNLLDVLDPHAAAALMQGVANSPGNQGGPAAKERKLSLLATDEYYKRNSAEIRVRSPKLEAETLELAPRIVPRLVASLQLTAQEVPDLPLDRIVRFQEETGIQQLFQVSDYEYRYDLYELEETPQHDYQFTSTGLELPENIVFHVDSSASMGIRQYVGTGSKFDTLQHVCYGTLKTMVKASAEMKKPVNVLAANFSNGTILSTPCELTQMYATMDNSVKRTLTGFQDGGTVYSSDTFDRIKKMLVPGRTVHVWATDGGLEQSCADDTYKAIEKAVQDPDTCFLYFEIGIASGFGQRIKRLCETRPNVKYYPNVSVKEIQDKALDVLLQYD